MIAFVPGQGILVVLDGFSIVLPLSMSVGAMGKHLGELREFYS